MSVAILDRLASDNEVGSAESYPLTMSALNLALCVLKGGLYRTEN